MNLVKLSAPLFALALAACPGVGPTDKPCDTATDCVTDTDTDPGTDIAADFLILEYLLECNGTAGELSGATSTWIGADRFFYMVDTKFTKNYDTEIAGTDITVGTNGDEGTIAASIDFSANDQGDGDDTLFECRDVVTGTGDFSVTMGLYATDADGNQSDCVVWGHAATALAEGTLALNGITKPAELTADCFVDASFEP